MSFPYSLLNIYPYAGLVIDCSTTQWLAAIKEAVYTSKDRQKLVSEIGRMFTPHGNLLVLASVRTSLDLYIQAKGFKQGSEVVITAINIPDMPRVLRMHGLVPVPIDLDIDTLQTTPQRVEEAITPKTCMVIISYVYGARYKLEQIAEVTRKYNLPIFEDCAEAFVGTSYAGDPNAEISSFSFGPIKTCTAFGGCVCLVRNSPETLARMREIHNRYPIQKSSTYLSKVLKTSIGMLAMNSRVFNILTRKISSGLGMDHKRAIVKLMRGFPPDKITLDKYRIQPCTALIAFLHKRLATFDENLNNKLIQKVKKAQDQLVSDGVQVPGSANDFRTYWLFPIMSEQTWDVYKKLDNKGIDVFKGVTQLDVIHPPLGSDYKTPENTVEYFKRLIYLPIHKEVPHKDLIKMCKDVSSIVVRSKL
jgi:dTDP-4-amino-4,6-dideoxygalactose transaminase